MRTRKVTSDAVCPGPQRPTRIQAFVWSNTQLLEENPFQPARADGGFVKAVSPSVSRTARTRRRSESIAHLVGCVLPASDSCCSLTTPELDAGGSVTIPGEPGRGLRLLPAHLACNWASAHGVPLAAQESKKQGSSLY